MLVLHANWTAGALRLWGESLEAAQMTRLGDSAALNSGGGAVSAPPEMTVHPFAVAADEIRAVLARIGLIPGDDAEAFAVDSIRLRLPGDAAGSWPSDRLARLIGAIDLPVDPMLSVVQVHALTIPNDRVLAVLLGLEARNDPDGDHALEHSGSLHYWITVANFIVDLLADQRVTPMLQHGPGATLNANWQPWFHDEDGRARVGALLASMPPIARAMIDSHHGRPWAILEEALRRITDATVRANLISESFMEAIDGRDPADPHVAWLGGLLGSEFRVNPPVDSGLGLLRDATSWINRLDDTGQGRPLHLCLRLHEPSPVPSAQGNGSPKSENPIWTITLHLQAADDAKVILDAAQIWSQPSVSQRVGGRRIDQPQELLLAELARAARLYPKIEEALADRAPTQLSLSTAEAYEFLREVMPVLDESGIGVIVPEWWDQPTGQLAARLHIESPQQPDLSATGTTPATSMLGLNSIVSYKWQIAIGDQALTAEEFRALTREHAPLVQVRGRWIEINPQQLADAQKLLDKSDHGQMTLLEAIHISHGVDGHRPSLPISGMDASGWVADVLGASTDEVRMPKLDQPGGFAGTLRPYQKTGLSWLSFLDRYGLGACLADDMGLGKTIQLIALLQHERQALGSRLSAVGESQTKDGDQLEADSRQPKAESVLSVSSIPPTLLVVPTSVVANWVRELHRFAPELTVHVQHGPERPTGDRFAEIASTRDIVITTYPLVSRDQETLQRVTWHRVALDEAQYIKNPPTKQTTAIRSLKAPHRLALTGTPVENRLSELWSIMEFCNPGYLGPGGEFRRRFAMAIERRRDPRQAEHLKRLVRPFILRRLKTDPTVIDDLPPCLETKEFATLTPEQAAMYQTIVDSMLGQVERAEGIQRRGLVLATLVRLKQICNHPAQLELALEASEQRNAINNQPPSDDDDQPAIVRGKGQVPPALVEPHRSGKSLRLLTMLEEVLSTGEKALIFTQFRQMGHLLNAMIQKELNCEALFLHGGTPAGKRQHLIDRFQDPNGGAPVFVLSLKAGGVGLNLTAANHVFHYDRWWNPAVENQATDRAFRIGQTRTVHVHKFVCLGTLEERIDQMIEQKTELARNIIGAGEQWLTELSTGQLRDLLILRTGDVEAES